MSDSMLENISHWALVLVMESMSLLALPMPLHIDPLYQDSQGAAARSFFLLGSGILFLGVAELHGRSEGCLVVEH